jgi:two-component system LytT family response regulator
MLFFDSSRLRILNMNSLPTSLILPQTPVLSLFRGNVHLLIADIVRLEGDRNYTCIIIRNGRRLMTSKHLGGYETELPDCFVRVHKGCLLNMHYLRHRRGRTLHLVDGTKLPLARRKVKLLPVMK